jgi:imidazolonepropionase-like amidohydrolase
MADERGQEMIAIRCGTLLDCTGAPPKNDQVVLVGGGRIKAVGGESSIDLPKNVKWIDGSEQVLMPGLIDVHTHLLGVRSWNPMSWMLDFSSNLGMVRAVTDVKSYLEAGYTTIQDVGSRAAITLRDAVKEGSIVGPRIRAAGRLISQTAGHGDMFMFLPAEIANDIGIGCVADGPDQCRWAARRQIRDGADLLKICTTGGMLSEKDESTHWHYTIEEIEAVTEEAHKTGRIVCSHSSAWKGVENAIEGGVDVVFHGYWQDGKIRKMFVDNDIVFNPTLAIVGYMAEHGEKIGITGYAARKAREAREVQLDNFKECLKAGIQIAHGSDFMGCTMVEQGTNAKELVAMAEAGMTPMQALLATTKVASKGVDMETKIGTVEVGKYADLLLVQEDPLKDLRSMLNRQNIAMVMKEGQVFVDRGIRWEAKKRSQRPRTRRAAGRS